MKDADKAGSGQLASVQRLPLASMRQNSLQLADWTRGLTMPGKKRGIERQRLQEKLISVAIVPAGLAAGPEAATSVLGTPARCVTDALQIETDTPAAMPQLRSPLMSPLRRTGVRGAPQRVATPAAERPVRQQLPPMRPEPFALASPRMDSTQHMAHQRAAAEAERLQRQRPVEAGSTAAELPPRTPRLPPAATAGQQPAEGSKDPVVSAPQPAGEAPHSRAASAAAAEVLRGKQQAANPEELQYLQGEPSADADGAQQSAATPACRRLDGSLPHRTPLGQPQRIVDPSARPLRTRELQQLTAGSGGSEGVAQAGIAMGSISLLSPVRGRPGQNHPQVSTPVRRSARSTVAAAPAAVVMQSTDYAYAPNSVAMPGSTANTLPEVTPRRTTAQRCRAPAAVVQPSPLVTPMPVEHGTATSPAVVLAGAAVASPTSEATASPSPSVAMTSPATPLAAGFARRVTRQMSALKAKVLASASKSGSKPSPSPSKSPSPSMSPTEQNIRHSLLRSARKKRGL